MNTGSIIVLAIVFGLCGLAIWRVHKKGTPCECGGNHKNCTCGGKNCHCGK